MGLWGHQALLDSPPSLTKAPGNLLDSPPSFSQEGCSIKTDGNDES